MYNRLAKNRNRALMVLILVFALAMRIVFFSGIDTSDSLFYTKFAYELSQNSINFNENNLALSALRIGILYPVSLLYRMFGVNEVSSNILVLLSSLASIILIYNFGKLLFNEKVGLLSAFLLGFFPLDVVYSTRLLTDVPSVFFAALGVYFFLKSEKINNDESSYLYCFLAGISIGIAYLIKELSLLIGLFFLVYAVYNKRMKSRYFFIALGFLIIFSIELLYFLNNTGNPLFRFSVGQSMWASSYTESNFYGRTGIAGLFHYPYVIFTDYMLSVFYIFIFIAVFYCIKNRKKESYNLLFWLVPLLAYMSFGSASLTRYIPIPAASRFLLITSFPGILLLSYFLLGKEPLIRKILMPSIIAVLFFTSMGYLFISEQRNVIGNERAAYQYIKTLPQKQIYTDDRTALLFGYFSGYKKGMDLKNFGYYASSGTSRTELTQISDSYVVVNWRLVNFLASSKKGIKLPPEIYNVPKNWILKKEFGKDKDKVMVYYVP